MRAPTTGLDLPYDEAALFGPGPQRTFTGEALREIAFPLGGIGTGSVSLGGRGNLQDWEIFNRPGKGVGLPFTFFALWARPEGGPSVARVLERQLLPPYTAGHGLPRTEVAGLPRLVEAQFRGEYPFATIAFEDPSLPLAVELEAWNPYVPLEADDSGLPVAIFRWRLQNTGTVPVHATVALSVSNPAEHDPSAAGGQTVNEWMETGTARGLRLTGAAASTAPDAGSLAVATAWPDVTYRTRWERAGGPDSLQSFWDGFRADGRLPDRPPPDPAPDGREDVGTLGLRVTLAPGASADLPFVLAWHFPHLTNYWNPQPAVQGQRLGNYYTERFADAWEVAEYTLDDLPRLEERTRLFHRTLFESTLPAVVLDAVSSQASILKTTTCLRTADGRFHAFEGCNDEAGCCPMNCTHVWNYEQTLAHLFPDLERTMRLTDLGVNTKPSGEMAFRTLLPVVSGELWDFDPAADGQMGTLLKLYREWQLSGDTEWLQSLWPHAKRTLEFAWQPGSWDADSDGVMEGSQHNTYDIEFFGPNTMTGTLYLGALRAGAEMAAALGDESAAAEYRRLYDSGRAKYDQCLWNGE
ncbi:MAG: hypothetical protein CL878_03705, partial [Dehalococcoidia bacterium]|nr:hypothetical protein [Dehalococcoidia bacterium]